MKPVAVDSILDLIGGTPAVRLHKTVASRPDVEVYAKLEGHNPTGSVKDRIALSMIDDAEKRGVLKPGATIVEASSGNTGIGLALVARARGYKLIITMSEGVSIERRKYLQALGAEIVLTKASLGTDGAIMRCRELREKYPTWFCPDQFSNPANRAAHTRTANEVWEQSGGRVTHFVAVLGTSGTLGGTSARLRELNPNVKIIEVQPEFGHKIQGAKNLGEAIKPAIYDAKDIDEHYVCETQRAYELSRLLCAEEGLFVGMSAGAALYGVLEILPKVPPKSVIYVIMPDRGEKYLSTALFPYTDPPPVGEEKY